MIAAFIAGIYVIADSLNLRFFFSLLAILFSMFILIYPCTLELQQTEKSKSMNK